MIKKQTAAAFHAATTSTGRVAPVLDLSGYTEVVIVKATDLDGHIYARGSSYLVDEATLAALQAADALLT